MSNVEFHLHEEYPMHEQQDQRRWSQEDVAPPTDEPDTMAVQRRGPTDENDQNNANNHCNDSAEFTTEAM